MLFVYYFSFLKRLLDREIKYVLPFSLFLELNRFYAGYMVENSGLRDMVFRSGRYRWFKNTQMKSIHKHHLFPNFYFICFPYKLKTIFRYITYTLEKRNAPLDAQ